MEMVYLGLFERIFNEVLDRIFMPIFDFVISIMNVGFSFIFNDVLAGVLLPVLEIAFEKYIIAYQFVFGTGTYEFFVKPCFSILDTVESAFDLFIGTKNVLYYPNGMGQPPISDKTLLEVMMSFPTVQNAFWLITASGIAIALLLSIYGVARSALDLDFENKKPVSHVMSQLFKTIVAAFLVPFMVLFMVRLAKEIVVVLDRTITVGNSDIGATDNSSMGSALFVMCTANAAWDNSLNRSTRRIQTTGHGIKLEVYDEINENFDIMGKPRNLFYANDKQYNYRNSLMVWRYFNPGKFDYFGFYTGIFVLVIMVICLLTLIKRLLELLILYMISPYFVAMMPLDDGEKFKEWFSMFMGKLFTGYGSLVALKVYLMLMPVFMRGGIQIPNSSVTTSDILYYVFAIGGAWSVYKSSSLLTNLINTSAGRSEEQSMAAGAGAVAAVTVRPVKSVATGIKDKLEHKIVDESVNKAKKEIKTALRKTAYDSTSKKIYQSGYDRKTSKIEKQQKKAEKKAAADKIAARKKEESARKKEEAGKKNETAKKNGTKPNDSSKPGMGKSDSSASSVETKGNKTNIPPKVQGVQGAGGGSAGTGSGSGESEDKIDIRSKIQGAAGDNDSGESGNKIDIPTMSEEYGSNYDYDSGSASAGGSGSGVDSESGAEYGSEAGSQYSGSSIDSYESGSASSSGSGPKSSQTTASSGSSGSSGSSAAPGASQSKVSDPVADLKEKLSDQRVKGQENNRGDKK